MEPFFSSHPISRTEFRHPLGVIHGRFQILHNDHLTYLLAGKSCCDHLVVGITNPDPFMTRPDPADPDRSSLPANPLTYYERYSLVRAALTEANLSQESFSIVPFPINFPERFAYYVPMDAVFFLTIYDDWGKRKKETFTALGLKTHVLWEVSPEDKGISAGEVRKAMISGAPWSHLVPGSVAGCLEKWGIAQRLKNLGNR